MQQRLPFSDDWPDLLLFAGVLIAGITFLVIAKLFGLHQGWITSVLVLLMIGYSFVPQALPGFRLRPDQLGDNAYYLGFLFTLFSLAGTLYAFSGSTDVVAEVVGGFGIALGTTIAGIALRVVLHQMRSDPADVEEQSRLMIARVTSELTAELNSSISEFRIFGRQVRQNVQEMLAENADQTNSTILEAAASFEKSMLQTTSKLTGALDQFTENAETLSSTSHGLTSSMSDLVERVGAIEAPADLVAKKIEPAIGKIGDVVDLLEKMAVTENARAETTNELLTSAKASIDANKQAIAESGTALGEVLKMIEQMKSATEGVSATSTSLIRDGQKASSQFIELANEVDGALQKTAMLVTSLEGSMEQLSATQDKLAHASDNGLSDAIDHITHALNKGSKEILAEQERTASTLATHRENLDYEASVASAATTELTASIQRLAKALGDQAGR